MCSSLFKYITLNKFFIFKKFNFFYVGRKLISQDTLKINTFIEARKNTANATDSEDFKNILKGKCADENNLIFIDDFRKMLKIASTNEDLETLILMLKK